MAHNFDDSLALSQKWAGAGWWREVYCAAFPDLQSYVNVRKDGWAQRGGIDRVLTLESGRTLNVDEKVREKDWPDILLEYYSDEKNRTPGWVAKDLATDFIAYAFIPSQRCYLLPFQTLRQAWRQRGQEWVKQYKICRAFNEQEGREWVTRSVAVPIEVLMQALSDAMLVSWEG